MFESPYYKLVGKKDGMEIVVNINVTGSAPHFEVPGKQLENCFNALMWTKDPCLEDVWALTKKPCDTNILDFGAAKLRNTLYFLEMGYDVTACDYPEVYERYNQANSMMDRCAVFDGFHFNSPSDLEYSDKKFDDILLINVMNCMPIPEERAYALDVFAEKVYDDSKLLWYSQHGSRKNTSGISVSDGFATGKGRYEKMFYKDFSRKEVEDMMKKSGFVMEENLRRYSGNNQAYIFRVE